MISTITQTQFNDAFYEANRQDQFSYEGKIALYDYLEELENDCNMTIELDVIGLCCEYSEYEDIEEFNKDQCQEYETIEELEDDYSIIKVNDEAFIIAN